MAEIDLSTVTKDFASNLKEYNQANNVNLGDDYYDRLANSDIHKKLAEGLQSVLDRYLKSVLQTQDQKITQLQKAVNRLDKSFSFT